MKTRIKYYLCLSICFLHSITTAQQFCSSRPQSPTLTPVVASNSLQLLNDLAPISASEPTLYVNVNIYVAVPAFMSSLSSVWTHSASPSTSLDAQTFLDTANFKMSHIPAIPQLTVATNTNTTFTDSKIRFVLKSFSYIMTNEGYIDVNKWSDGDFGTTLHDPTAINVFFGTQSNTAIVTGSSGTFVAATHIVGTIGKNNITATTSTFNAIHFNPEFFSNITPTCTYNCQYDNIRSYGSTFAHEACHALGLDHSMGVATTYSDCCDVEEQAYITPTFGCTNFVAANDYFSE